MLNWLKRSPKKLDAAVLVCSLSKTISMGKKRAYGK